jgi:ring-1,2-phenylacetyl-CoA epoxidase subunit PaaC
VSIQLRTLLADALICLADDELILGHRDSEWCGHAPILEEDIAFANIALDEIGHANLWYREAAALRGEDPEKAPDRLVYFRTPREYRCMQLVEQQNGDWAFSMLRQYLFDAAELVRMQAMSGAQWGPVANVAQRILKEEIYHLRHTRAWIIRLGAGTSESHSRLQTALDQIWPLSSQILAPLPGEAELLLDGYLPDSQELRSMWLTEVDSTLTQAGLKLPTDIPPAISREQHSVYLGILLRELQSVVQLDPQAEW